MSPREIRARMSLDQVLNPPEESPARSTHDHSGQHGNTGDTDGISVRDESLKSSGLEYRMFAGKRDDGDNKKCLHGRSEDHDYNDYNGASEKEDDVDSFEVDSEESSECTSPTAHHDCKGWGEEESQLEHGMPPTLSREEDINPDPRSAEDDDAYGGVPFHRPFLRYDEQRVRKGPMPTGIGGTDVSDDHEMEDESDDEDAEDGASSDSNKYHDEFELKARARRVAQCDGEHNEKRLEERGSQGRCDGVLDVKHSNLTSHCRHQQTSTRDANTKRQRDSATPEPGEEGGRPNLLKSAKILHSSSTMVDHRHSPGAERPQYALISPNLGSNSRIATQELAKLDIPPPLVLSPSKSNIYIRRQSTSPVRLPNLSTPYRRDPRTFRDRTPEPPSPEVDISKFNVFHGLLSHPELMLEMSKHLEVQDLLDLYAISRDYHDLVDNRFTAFMMGQAIGKASESAKTFSFRAYRNLCKRDPAGRLVLFNVSEKDQTERVATAKDHDVRFVPSFRWLRMVLHHEAVVDCILRCLAEEGHRLPKRTTLVLKKLWYTLDVSDNGRRIGLLHDTHFWSNKDLFVATMFFIKLDMRLTDPNTGDGETGLRTLLLAQKSLETLARVLAGEEMRTQLELLRLIVRHDYSVSKPLEDGQTLFGVPADEVGKLCYEGRGKGDKKLVPIDELIMREAVRRRLNLQHHYVDMMLYGYVNKRTWEDVRAPMKLKQPVHGDDVECDTESSETSSVDTDAENAEREKRETMGLFEGETEEEVEDGEVQEESLGEDGMDVGADE